MEILAGVRHGKTLGSPVAVIVRNSEWPRWQEAMSADPVEDSQEGKKLTAPRPGHADLAGMLKYNTRDARDILERASARETAARTVVGYLAKQLLAEIDVKVLSHVVSIGKVTAPEAPLPRFEDLAAIDESPVRCFYPEAAAAMIAEIESAKADRDTLGGVVEVLVYGLPAGIGSHVHWDRRLDARLAQALMSIQAIKGVELGDGFESARRRGSEAHDEIFYEDGFVRHTTRAGGTEGRDVDRRPAAGQGRDETDLDGAQRPANRGYQHQGSREGVLRTVRHLCCPGGRGRGRADGRDRRRPGMSANLRRGHRRRFPAGGRGIPGPVRAVLSAFVADRNDGIRKERRGPGCWQTELTDHSSTPICWSRRPPACRRARSLKRRVRRVSGSARRTRSGRPLASRKPWSLPAGGPCCLTAQRSIDESSGPVVWLQADPATLAARIGHTPEDPC